MPGKLFQSSPMSVGKATLDRCLTLEGSGLTYKQKTRLERLDNDKHSSLLRKIIKYGQKSITKLSPVLNNSGNHLFDVKRNQSYFVLYRLSYFKPESLVTLSTPCRLNMEASGFPPASSPSTCSQALGSTGQHR